MKNTRGVYDCFVFIQLLKVKGRMKKLQKRKLGQSDLFVSKLGLGCMSLGTEDNKAKKIIETALDEGINYFDTADLYHFGVNESIVGTTLKSVRDQVIIATKVGNRWEAGKTEWWWDPSKQYIKEAVKKSLKRLQTDYIDLYQLHGGTIDDPIDDVIDAFEELKSEGLIKEYGISSIRPNVIRQYASKSSIVSVMMQYSLLDRRPEMILPLLSEHHISVVARGSVAKGFLTDRMLANLSQHNGALGVNAYLDYSPQQIIEVLESIRQKLLANRQRTMTEIALQFNLANEGIASVVAGASTSEQVTENVKAVEAPSLTAEEYKVLLEITKKNEYTQHY